jgi:NitT/TauT family transport system substrate-binding protein
LLRIATNPWIGYESLYLARELGLIDNAAIRLVELPSNSDSLQALVAGTVEGAGLTLDEVLSARAEGMDLKVVAIFDFSAGADVLLARPGIERLENLAGRRIGLEETALGALMLGAVLKTARLPASAVTKIHLTFDQHRAAFESGQVDAIITFDPVTSQLESDGARRLFDSRAIPGQIVDVLAVRSEILASGRENLTRLISAHFQALAHLREQPDDAARRIAPQMEITPEALLAAYNGLELPDLNANRRWFAGTPSPMEKNAGAIARTMLEAGLVSKEVSVTGLFDGRFLMEGEWS